MKTKISIGGLFGLILWVSWACTDHKDLDPVTYESNARLQRTLLYSSVNDKNPIAIVDEYTYDPLNRISKVSSPMYNNGTIIGTIKYDLYEYNSAGQLTSISNFNANQYAPSGYLNLRKQIYTYSSNGLKEKQYIEYPQINSFEYTLYTYKNEKLIKEEKFDNKHKLEDYIIYEYNDNRLIKETRYLPNGEINTVSNSIYTNGLNTKTEIYAGSKKEKIREIKKTYDSNRNLIMIESAELAPWSSATSYVMKYEYH